MQKADRILFEKDQSHRTSKEKNETIIRRYEKAGWIGAGTFEEPEFLIVDEPTTGLDPEERIRIRNLLVDFSENRTVLFSTHVVEDLAATCNQLAIMHKGSFLYAGSMKNLTEEAQGKIWVCKVPDEEKAREVERKYRITSKQYVEGGLQLRVISEIQPELECMSVPATLEDAYIYFTNRYNK